MFVALLGFLDLFATAMLLWPDLWADILVTLGIIYLIKGGISFVGSVLGGFWFDVMGIVDLLVAVSLIFAFEIPFLWVALLVKGLFSAATGW